MASAGAQTFNQPTLAAAPATLDPGGMAVVDFRFQEDLISPIVNVFILDARLSFNSSAFTAIVLPVARTPRAATCTQPVPGQIRAQLTHIDFEPRITTGPLCRITFTANSTQATRNSHPMSISVTVCDNQAAIGKQAPKAPVTCNTSAGSLRV